jgi:hypothetical protein
MNEPNDQNQQSSEQQQQPQPDLFEELKKLSGQFEQAARSVVDNNRTKSFQRDVGAGMQEFFTQMQNATKSVQDDPRVQNFVERGQQAVQDAQQSQAMKDFQTTMARSVAFFNQQLGEFSERMRTNAQEEQANTTSSTSTSAQDVPIDEEDNTASEQTPPPPPPPSTGPGTAADTSNTSAPGTSTGPTIRLDPDDDHKQA